MGFAVLCCTKRAGEARAPEALHGAFAAVVLDERKSPNIAFLEAEGTPGIQDAAGRFSEKPPVAAAQSHHGRGPAHDAGLHAFQAFDGKRARNRRIHQREAVAATLEMVVPQK